MKQAVCNQILGCTFKDVERAMEGVLKERPLPPQNEEEIETPQKFDPEFEFMLYKKKQLYEPGYRTYTEEEVAKLIAASEAPFITPEPPPKIEYPTYSREQVEAFMQDHFEYLEREKKLKEERKEWDSLKTTEFEIRTLSGTKPSEPTKS